ncbi:hypothetical protein EDD86DRAFT_270835 [Gorgonomyces haynaldii]|nr:hypothetical protein EDD86DRAFT_270835 [Gorgonomyces haynaldii]
MTLDWMSHPNTSACLVTDSILSDCRSPSAMQHLTASHSQSLVAEGQDPLFSDSGVSNENVPIDGSDAMEERQEAVSAQPSSDRDEQRVNNQLPRHPKVCTIKTASVSQSGSNKRPLELDSATLQPSARETTTDFTPLLDMSPTKKLHTLDKRSAGELESECPPLTNIDRETSSESNHDQENAVKASSTQPLHDCTEEQREYQTLHSDSLEV